MIDRTRQADLLLAVAAVGLPWLASLLGVATSSAVLPDLAGVVISIVVLLACIAAGYAALRRYGRFETL
ncbi:hypothetical protein [Nocardia sp. NPDC003963]